MANFGCISQQLLLQNVNVSIEISEEASPTLPELVSEIEQGLPKKRVDTLAEQLGLTKNEVLDLLGCTRSQFSRWKSLNEACSEKVLLLQELASRGYLAFDGDVEEFKGWIRRENPLLDHLSPLKACRVIAGIQASVHILGRIRTGDFIA